MKKFDLKMPIFIPKNKKLPIIDLYSATNPLMDQFTNQLQNWLREKKLSRVTDERLKEEQEKLKVAIRKYLQLPNSIKNENIIFGFGSYSILERLALKVLPKGLMIGEFPQFRFFPMEYCLGGGDYRPFIQPNFIFPAEKIEDALKKDKKISVVYINNPNNPTGKSIKLDVLKRIIELSQKRKIAVVIDEVYADLKSVKSSCASWILDYNNLMVVRSFSKIFGLSNLRVGYMITGKTWAQKYQKMCNWEEITNIGAFLGKIILEDKSYRNKLKKISLKLKKMTIKCFLDYGYEIFPSDPNVPIFLIRKRGVDLEKWFASLNIWVKGSWRYRSIVKNFPFCYARVRIPTKETLLGNLRERLDKNRQTVKIFNQAVPDGSKWYIFLRKFGEDYFFSTKASVRSRDCHSKARLASKGLASKAIS